MLVTIYDQGGDWGTEDRSLDGEDPTSDPELSLDPSGSWMPDRTDADGDGERDVCDDTPLGGSSQPRPPHRRPRAEGAPCVLVVGRSSRIHPSAT